MFCPPVFFCFFSISLQGPSVQKPSGRTGAWNPEEIGFFPVLPFSGLLFCPPSPVSRKAQAAVRRESFRFRPLPGRSEDRPAFLRIPFGAASSPANTELCLTAENRSTAIPLSYRSSRYPAGFEPAANRYMKVSVPRNAGFLFSCTAQAGGIKSIPNLLPERAFLPEGPGGINP